jgi:pre-mRNA-processing factor 19
MFQNEWDAVILETFNLKKQLETARRELTHQMYQHDAACRVIARLIKERDLAREELERWKSEVHGGRPEFQFRAFPNEVMDRLKEKFEQLTDYRKKREFSPSLSTVNDIEAFKCVSTHPTHKTTNPGILCVDYLSTNPNIIVSGGVDKTAVVFDMANQKKIATLGGHEKQVNTVAFHSKNIVFTGSDDTTVKVWTPTDGGGYECSKTFTEHKGPITKCAIHPTNLYLLTASRDSSWGFFDFQGGMLLTLVMDPDRSPFTCASFHPDGYIFATGTQNSLIRVWDIRSQKNVATFQGYQDKINDIQFSENGIYLATCSQDNTVKVWDLRGPSNISTLNLELTPNTLSYDSSGSYLAVGVGREIRIFTENKQDNVKNLVHVKNLDEHTDIVTGLKWGPDAHYIVSTSMDRNVKYWTK